MTYPSLGAYRILIDALPESPIRIARGVSILHHDLQCHSNPEGKPSITGSLLVSLWGRMFELHSDRPGIFEGTRSKPLLDLGDVGSFVLEYLCIAVDRAASKNALSFDITGRGRLEIRGVSALGPKPFVIQGELFGAYSRATDDTHLRVNLAASPMLLPIVGGVVFLVSTEQLIIVANASGRLELELRVACSVLGLPKFLQSVLGTNPITTDMRLSRQGLSIRIDKVCQGLRLVLPSLPSIGHLPPRELGTAGLSLSKLHIDIGRDIQCKVDVTVQVPKAFQSIIEPQISARIMANSTDIELLLLSSPLCASKFFTNARGSFDAHVDLGRFGSVSFTTPRLLMDWATGSFVAAGTLSFRNLRIPLAPIVSLLNAAGMQSFAKRLPESIGLQPFGWMDLATAFTNLITQTLGASVIAERARAELNHLVERMDLLPHHLRESLLHVEFPTDLAFRIELTSDLGAQIQLSPIAPPGPTAHGVQSEDVEPKAMKLLIPLLGPSGPEWIGLSLRHIAFSQIRAGQLFAIEVDADVDRFELLPLALSMTLAKEGTFTRPDDLQQRLSCRKMVALLAFPSGTPVLVPVFFDELSIQWMGLDGFGASGRWSFPAPKMAFAALMRLLAHVENAAMVRPGQFLRSLKLPEHVLLTLTTGPFWIRLPTYLGGGRVDIEQATAELDTPETLARFLRAVQQVDIDGFLETIPFAMGEHLLDLEIGSSFRTALRRWSTIAGPALIVSAWSALRDDGDALPSARIADKLRSRKGIFALGGATSEKYVAARLVGITSTGIEIVVILPLASAQPPVEHRFELRWSHLLASVMEVAEKMM